MESRSHGSPDEHDTAWLSGLIIMFGLLVVLMMLSG